MTHCAFLILPLDSANNVTSEGKGVRRSGISHDSGTILTWQMGDKSSIETATHRYRPVTSARMRVKHIASIRSCGWHSPARARRLKNNHGSDDIALSRWSVGEFLAVQISLDILSFRVAVSPTVPGQVKAGVARHRPVLALVRGSRSYPLCKAVSLMDS